MMKLARGCATLLLTLGALACGGTEPIEPEGGGGASAGTGGVATTGGGGQGEGGAGGSTTSSGGGAPCPAGVTCVSSFPFSEQRDTSSQGTSAVGSYDCSPDTNEGGPEILYRVTVPSDGFLSVAAYDGDGVDIDVHILTSLDPNAPQGTSCVARGDHHASADVTAGEAWIVADTWVNGSGVEQKGAFRLDIGFLPVVEGPCGMATGSMARVGDGGDSLPMPATGPVVMEAHLVTMEEPEPYPQSPTEELEAHYALSQSRTGLVMFREQVWAPKEGGGVHYGAGIGSPSRFPTVDEGWYVNMYWTPASRPPRGGRMILRRTDDPSRAVVVAAGYETGPGDLSKIAGTTEETHFYLGTGHDSELTLGIAQDQSLPFGPRKCTD